MSVFVLRMYGFILRMHPLAFRTEFGGEMLWIFEEQVRCVKNDGVRAILCIRLLLDAVRSAFVQGLLRGDSRTKAPVTRLTLLEVTSGALEVVQAGLVAASCLFTVFSIVLSLHLFLSSI